MDKDSDVIDVIEASPVDTSKVNVLRYLLFNAAIPLAVVFGVVVISFVGNGMYEHYLDKKREVLRLAKVLARTAALDDFGLVSVLVSESIEQDTTLRDIHFYSIDTPIELNNHLYDDWQNALINPSVSFSEGVMVAIEAQETLPVAEQRYKANAYSHAASAVGLRENSNTALVGYIIITLDLTELRRHWLRHNLISLLLLPGIALALLSVIYWRMRLPANQIRKMSNRAQSILAQKSLDVGTIVHSEKGFYELESIRQLIIALDHRYKDALSEVAILKKNQATLKPQNGGELRERGVRSMIVHELKGSLNTVLDGVRLLDNHYISNEQAEAVAAIRTGSQELDFLFKQIILIDLMDKGLVGVSLTELQPAQLLNNLIQEYRSAATEKGLYLETHINHIDHVLAGDVQKIRSILAELLTNAIQYTTKGGISVESRMDYFAESIRWTVQVTDTGQGIEQKHLEDVFVPFFSNYTQKKHSSNGIGLGVAKRLAQLLGGELSVQSSKDEGTTFSLVLQLQDWRDDALFRMLSGINIAGLEHSRSGLYLKNLQTYGAQVHILLDTVAVLEYIAANRVNILLIADSVGLEEVTGLCQRIREQEENQRILIAWYNLNINNEQQARLESIGLDYIMDPTLSFEAQASEIKSWTML